VKVFQAVALNNNFIDNEINEHLLSFTDNAPWTYDDILFGDIIEVSNQCDMILKYGYEKPINAGMISVVFKAYKKITDKPMIIKLKRNNIEKKLAEAIQQLETLIYLLSFIPFIQKYQISEIVRKNINMIQSQTDFLQEVNNINKMKKNCTHLKYVKIPYVEEGITERYPNIIVMECIEGMKINAVANEDYEGFARQIMKLGMVTSLVHGVAHGDLHSGNILFIKDIEDEKYPYKIGLLDFGIIYEIEETFREILFDTMVNLFDTPTKETAIKLLNSGIIDPPGILQQIKREHYENIVKIVEEIIDETIQTADNTNQGQLFKFLYKLNEYLRNSEISRFGIRPSANMVKSQIALTMSHGVALKLCKNNLVPILNKVIEELFHTNILQE
jgi:predicted unusual protein kinase regulating ubiquinone biosynthesis (AarF/ABC1/UbiB family)